jgi:hypothetical protein
MTDVIRTGPRHARADSDEWERLITTGELRLPDPPWDRSEPRKAVEQLGRLRWWWWVKDRKGRIVAQGNTLTERYGRRLAYRAEVRLLNGDPWWVRGWLRGHGVAARLIWRRRP